MWHVREMDQVGIWATVAMSGALLAEKIVNRFNLYDGVRSLHMNCSRCCDVDIQRTDPNSRGGSATGNIALMPPPPPPPPTATPVPEPTLSRDITPTIEELMRRVSIALVEPIKEKITP